MYLLKGARIGPHPELSWPGDTIAAMNGYERPVKRAGKTIGFIERSGPLYVAKDIHRRPLRGSHSRLDALDAVWRSADQPSTPSL